MRMSSQGGGIVSRWQGARLDNEGLQSYIYHGYNEWKTILKKKTYSLALNDERQFL